MTEPAKLAYYEESLYRWRVCVNGMGVVYWAEGEEDARRFSESLNSAASDLFLHILQSEREKVWEEAAKILDETELPDLYSQPVLGYVAASFRARAREEK